MPSLRTLFALPALLGLLAAAGCSSNVLEGLKEGDATCQRAAGSEGGCTAVPSNDRYEQERDRIRENRKGSE